MLWKNGVCESILISFRPQAESYRISELFWVPIDLITVLSIAHEDVKLYSSFRHFSQGCVVVTKNKFDYLKGFGFHPSFRKLSLQNGFDKQKPSERYYLNEEDGVYLTSREAEVSCLLAQGNTIREASEKMDISVRTAEFYLCNVRRKLGVRNRHELLRMLFDNDFFQRLLSQDEK